MVNILWLQCLECIIQEHQRFTRTLEMPANIHESVRKSPTHGVVIQTGEGRQLHQN